MEIETRKRKCSGTYINHNLLQKICDEIEIKRVYKVKIYGIYPQKKRLFKYYDSAVEYIISLYQQDNLFKQNYEDREFRFLVNHYIMAHDEHQRDNLDVYYAKIIESRHIETFKNNKKEYKKYKKNREKYLLESPFVKEVLDFGLMRLKRAIKENTHIIVGICAQCIILSRDIY